MKNVGTGQLPIRSNDPYTILLGVSSQLQDAAKALGKASGDMVAHTNYGVVYSGNLDAPLDQVNQIANQLVAAAGTVSAAAGGYQALKNQPCPPAVPCPPPVPCPPCPTPITVTNPAAPAPATSNTGWWVAGGLAAAGGLAYFLTSTRQGRRILGR